MLDEELRLALEEYDEVILASLPEPSQCDHQFSPRFERKMRTLCRRAKHPVAYQTLRRVACVLLALLALFGSIMAFNSEARAAVLDWIKKAVGMGTGYSYEGEQPPSTEERKRYQLGWMPEGYTFVDTLTSELRESVVYYGESPKMMQFTYIHGEKKYFSDNASPLYIDTSSCDAKKVSLKSGTADVYLEREPGKNNAIVWTNAEKNVLFCITAPCSEQELIKMAENIVEKN